MKISIINIGDELLNGQIINTNATWICDTLSKHHFEIQNILIIPDKANAILQNLHFASKEADVILITGGLGPTQDDITIEVMADYFSVSLEENLMIREHIIQKFTQMGIENIPQNNFKQTKVWEDCELIPNDFGTAFGLWKEYKNTIYIVLPGVPFEMKEMITNHVLPKLLEKDKSDTIYHNEYILTTGIGESLLAERIRDVENGLPSYIKLAYLPRLNQVLLRLTGTSKNSIHLEKEMKMYRDAIADKIPKYILAFEDTSLDKHILNVFTEEGLTVATAESCTGGKIATTFVNTPGSGKIFKGTVVGYANEAKTELIDIPESLIKQHGVVSEEVARLMADNIQKKLKTDYAISTTGIAGPTGATSTKPVGMVWIAIAGKTKTIAKVFYFKNDRWTNIDRTVIMSLKMLWDLYVEENLLEG